MIKAIGEFFNQTPALEVNQPEEQKSTALTQKQNKFLKSMFSSLMNIAESIMRQIFEKVSVIPYAIRQFCKMLYQKAMEKFGPRKELNFERAISLVSHYLLHNWLLKACF